MMAGWARVFGGVPEVGVTVAELLEREAKL